MYICTYVLIPEIVPTWYHMAFVHTLAQERPALFHQRHAPFFKEMPDVEALTFGKAVALFLRRK